jgi:hypothetical protein
MAGIGGGTIIPLADLGILAVGMVCIIFISKGIDRVLMVLALFLVMALVCLKANAAEVATNDVLTVNQKGETSHPTALATTADMAAIKAAAITAEEKASAAEAAARHGTNLVKDVIADIGRNELVIYRYGYTDGISAAQVLDPDAQLIISDFSPLDEQNAGGLQAFEIEYALKNSTEYQGQPIIRWRGALNKGDEITPIEAANVEPVTRLDPPYTDAAGIVYPYRYKTKFFDAAADQGFYSVILIPDDTAGDGAAMELPNGVKGGLTMKVNWGGYELEITGGIVTGVK